MQYVSSSDVKGCVAIKREKNLSHLARRCWTSKSPQVPGTERIPDTSSEFGVDCETTEIAPYFVGDADGAFRAREIRRLEPQMGQRGRQERNWSTLVKDRRQMDRPEIRVDPIPIPPLSFEGARMQRRRITKQNIEEFGATVGWPRKQRSQRQKKGASPFRSLQSTN